jgi:U2-associated protein SR140
MEKEDLKEFPDVSQKLAAPKKISAFEKERLAAQAKQQRAEAENAAALREFEDAFNVDNDDDDLPQHLTGGRGPPSGPRGSGYSSGFGGSSGRYGMPPGPPRSGPGSLGALPGPPPPNMKRKRALDELREAQEARREYEMQESGYSGSDSRGSPQPMTREEAKDFDAPRPTVQLSSLPPNISVDELKSLLRDHVAVQSIHFLQPGGPGTNSKRSASAIATLSSDVSTSQIDTAVSALKDKYLGCGFFLSISRYLSSAAMHPSVAANISGPQTEPFGAEKPRDQSARFSMRNAPPPMDQRGFAPPDSYDSPSRQPYGSTTKQDPTVSVQPPLEIEAVKAIHTVVDHLLLEPDPERALETEAMLMSLPEVQRDERFGFLYDSKSPAGVYYRYLLWSPQEQDEATKDMKRRDQLPEKIHEDVPISWVPPYSQLQFPDLKSLEQVVTDIDYVSSDEESDDEGGERQFYSGRDEDAVAEVNEKKHLTPLQRARLVHILSRLPTSNTRLRKGDVARVTSFAINHAGQGAEEIVDLLLLNVQKPFSYSLASKYEDSDQEEDEEDEYEPDDDLTALDSTAPAPPKDSKRDDDPSNAKLIALYIISDILSASSTAGARNAWKYRQLFESGFKALKTFEHLGKLDKELAWGRLKAEQWKRKVGVIFSIWEGWSVFSSEVHEELKMNFFEPPLTEEEKAAAQAEAEREEKRKQDEKWMGKFKRIGQAGSPGSSASPAPPSVSKNEIPAGDDVDGVPMDDVNGTPMEDDIDGVQMEDVDGVPMEDDLDGMPMGMDGAADQQTSASNEETNEAPSPAAKANGKTTGPRRRMRAEDMFADSDGE